MCGGREWDDGLPIRVILRGCVPHQLHLIHGAARGADMIADAEAHTLAVANIDPFPADWRGNPRGAGHIRNKVMLDQGPISAVFAFKDGFDHTLKTGGTEGMVKIARAAGVPTYVISHE